MGGLSDNLFFLLLGLGTGSMYAALALGVIVVYRGTGVVNFALRRPGDVPRNRVRPSCATVAIWLLPVVRIPSRYGLGGPWGLLPAAVLAIVVGTAISAAAYLLVFRPLRDAQPLTVVVATVALVIVLQGLALRSFGSQTVRTPSILPRSNIDLYGRSLPVDRLWMTLVVVVMAVLLTVLYRRTRFGIATRAGAENERGAVLLGFDLVRLGILNWMLAAVIVGSVGILVTPLSGVSPVQLHRLCGPRAGGRAGRAVEVVRMGSNSRPGQLEAFKPSPCTSSRRGTCRICSAPASIPSCPSSLSSWPCFAVGHTLPNRATLIDRHRVVVGDGRATPLLAAAGVAVAVGLALWADTTVRLGLIQSAWVTVLLLSMVVISGFAGPDLIGPAVVRRISRVHALEDDGWVGYPVPVGAPPRYRDHHGRWSDNRNTSAADPGYSVRDRYLRCRRGIRAARVSQPDVHGWDRDCARGPAGVCGRRYSASCVMACSRVESSLSDVCLPPRPVCFSWHASVEAPPVVDCSRSG